MKYIKSVEELLPKGRFEKQEDYDQNMFTLKNLLNRLYRAAISYEVDSRGLYFDAVEVNMIGGELKIQVVFKNIAK